MNKLCSVISHVGFGIRVGMIIKRIIVIVNHRQAALACVGVG